MKTRKRPGRAMCEVMRAPFFGDLDENLLAGLEQFADCGEVGGLHGAASTAAVTASARAFAVGGSAGVTGTIIAIAAITSAEAASVTTAIAAATATIVAAIAAGRRSGCTCCVVEAGRSFAAFGELLVDNVLFSIGFVEVFLIVFFLVRGKIVESGIVEGVLFFEVLLFIDVA